MTAPFDPTPPATGSANDIGPATVPRGQITGVILAGGLGRRMGGRDKGLLELGGRPLVARIIDVLRPQVGPLVLNANRNVDRYRSLGYPVVQDLAGGFHGPLAGMASALRTAKTPFLLTVPCDSPLLPGDLCARLYRALVREDAQIGVAHDGTRMQPVFALLRRELLPDLLAYLERGGRKIDTWYARHRFALADFSDCSEDFLNANTPGEWPALEAAVGRHGD